MAIPENIKIGGIEYRVEVVDTAGMGETIFARQLIRIDREQGQQMQESTLLHEIIEAGNHQYNIGLKHHQIVLIESLVYQVLRDNKMKFGK